MRVGLNKMRGAQAALFAIVCLCSERGMGRGGKWRLGRQGGFAGVAAKLAALDEDLVEYELSWMPWKRFNYSVPSAVNYCPHQHCMRCSAPFEKNPHLYHPCRAVPTVIKGHDARNSVLLEVASSHLPFGALARKLSPICYAVLPS